MKKNYLLLSFFFVAFFATINVTTVKSKVTSPPAGNAGDPITNLNCINSGCHGGTAQTPGQGDLTLNIGTGNPTTALNSSFQYVPGTVYNIAFAITSSTGRYGFQIVPLTSANAMAGSFTVSNAATTKINTLSGRSYMGHLNANTTKNWVFKWNAPAAGGPVTFYYAYNTANNDNTVLGDVIYKGSVTINSTTTGIENINDKISELNVYPNPINSEFGISFSLNETDHVSAQLYSLDGRMVRELINDKITEGSFNRQFDVSDLPAGVYLTKLNVGSATVSRKTIKL